VVGLLQIFYNQTKDTFQFLANKVQSKIRPTQNNMYCTSNWINMDPLLTLKYFMAYKTEILWEQTRLKFWKSKPGLNFERANPTYFNTILFATLIMLIKYIVKLDLHKIICIAYQTGLIWIPSWLFEIFSWLIKLKFCENKPGLRRLPTVFLALKCIFWSQNFA